MRLEIGMSRVQSRLWQFSKTKAQVPDSTHMGPTLAIAYVGGNPGNVQTFSMVRSAPFGQIISVRADSSEVSWLNVRVTQRVQDTSLGSNHSPFENPPGDDTQWKVQSEREFGTDDVRPEWSTLAKANGQKRDIS